LKVFHPWKWFKIKVKGELMSKVVDARGLACPQPVVLTKRALQEADQVTTIVDNETSATNVSRMATKAGCEVKREDKDEGTYLYLSRTGEKPVEEGVAVPAEGPTVVFISAWAMGRGPEELGDILMRAFLHTLNEVSPLPDTLIFVNAGVKLTVEGSPVLEDLQTLGDQGVEILVCGTCLGYFGLKDRIVVGEVSNMYTIAETLLGAGKVISP
jgi:selenium metabolism protein YedF